METTCARAIKTLLFITPFISLYVSPSLVYPYITGKNFAFRILVELAAAFWLCLAAVNKEYRPRNSAVVMSVLAFTFVVGLADLFGVSPYNSFWSNYERMEGYVTTLHLALYFIIIKSVLRTDKEWKIFLNIFVSVSVLVSLYALIFTPISDAYTRYVWTYGTRVSGTFGNPPFLASYLLFSAFFGLLLIANTHRQYLKFIYLLPVILNFILIYLTASRGAIISAVAGVIIFILLYLFTMHKKKPFNKALIILVSLAVISLLVLFVSKNTGFMKYDRAASRFSKILSDKSVETRLNTWGMAWNGIKERPLLGWGQENYIGIYSINPIPLTDERQWVDKAHNVVIEWLVSAGFPGLISYLAIFAAAFYILLRTCRRKIISENETIIVAIALIVYFIQNLFTFDTINTYLLFFTLIAYIDNLESAKKGPSTDKKDTSVSKSGKIIFPGAALLAVSAFVFVCYHVNYKPIRQLQLSVRTSNSYSAYSSYKTLLDDFNSALSYRTYGDYDVMRRMSAISKKAFGGGMKNREGELEFIQRTAEEWKKGIAYNRHNLEYFSDMINFYYVIAKKVPSFIAQTEALIKDSLNINPEYQWLNMVLADTYLLKKDYDNAFTSVNKLVHEDPGNDKKQLKLALSAILASKEGVLHEALENIKKIRAARNKYIASRKMSLFSVDELYQFARTYEVIKNYPEALQYYKEINVILTDNNQLHYTRDIRFHSYPKRKAMIYFETARIYLILGNKTNAIKEAKKAAEIDPVNFSLKGVMIN